MIGYMIKNNGKLMFRNTWSVVFMLIGPILVIAVLSSAFSALMKSYEGGGKFIIGYRMEDSFHKKLQAIADLENSKSV